MTDKTTKLIVWVALACSIFAVIISFVGKTANEGKMSFGAAGNMLAENYISYVMYNGGYNSAKDIKTSANISGAAGTFTGLLSSTGTFSLGASGTTLTQILKGTCVLGTKGPASIDASQSATTTVVYDCPVTGVVSGDTVIAQFATSTAQIANGWVIEGSKASTTAGYIEVAISNLTGASAVPSSTGVGSSTAYIIIR